MQQRAEEYLHAYAQAYRFVCNYVYVRNLCDMYICLYVYIYIYMYVCVLCTVCIYLEDPGAEYSAAAPGGVIFRVEEKRNAVDCVIPPTAM